MKLLFEIIQFIFYSLLIVGISKYILVTILRRFAESLDLKAKTIGNITGIATSIPEFLSVSFSSFSGLVGASIYNILSSNIINFVQYIITIVLNKNNKILKNNAIKIDIFMVIITIIIPIIMLIANIELRLEIIPIFILLFILFYYINSNTHKLYLIKQNKEEENIVEEEKKFIRDKKRKIIKYSIYLFLIGISLFLVRKFIK